MLFNVKKKSSAAKMNVKRKEMTPDQKQIVIILADEGKSQRYIAEILGVSQTRVCTFLKRFSTRGNIENIPRTERPLKAEENCQGSQKNRRTTLADLTNIVNESLPQAVSSRSVRRRLRFSGYTRRKVRKVLTFNTVNRRKRVSWCRNGLKWTLDQNWKSVIFSDETQVKINNQKRVFVWRRADEVWKPECLGQRGSTCISAMFWGCVTYNGVGTLELIPGNIDSRKYIEVLDNKFWPIVAKIFHGKDWTFQEDNAPTHTSRLITSWKNENNIPCLTWPSQI